MEPNLSVDESLKDVHQFFVYGTLKRGERNESVWPRRPIGIDSAWMRGALFAGSDYPALLPGDDEIEGELWTFDQASTPIVLQALDLLEGTTDNAPDDLYHRKTVEVFRGSEAEIAYTYFYNRDPIADGFSRVRSDAGRCRWP